MGILDLFRGSKDARIARRVMATMRALGESRRMEFNEPDSVITVFDEDGKPAGTWSLGNLRHELDGAGDEDHEAIYQRYSKGFTALRNQDDTTYEAARPTLRILLKDSTYPAYIELLNRVEHGAEKTNPLVWRHVAADIIACCIEETETSLSFATMSDLERWGVTAEQALDDAYANMRALPIEFGGSGAARYMNTSDSFIAARLVCEDAIRELQFKGLPVAVIPDRDTMCMVGSEEEEALAGLARLNDRQFEEANRHISGRPLVLTRSGWKEFTPPESSRMAFGNIARKFDVTFWTEYQKLLEKDLAAKGEDIFVATMSLFQKNDTGELFTALTWTRDVDSIFPKTDRVGFFDLVDESIREAEWDDVFRVMGSGMSEMEGYPLRYRVNGFPTPEQFLQMGAKLV